MVYATSSGRKRFYVRYEADNGDRRRRAAPLRGIGLREKATEDVLAALRSDSRLTLYYAHGPDHAGHMHGFSPHTQEYLRAIENMDASVKRIWDCIRALREDERRNEEWLIIMTTDHGGTSRSDMPRAMQERMDCARDCGYGQRKCEGVHGLGDCACHRNTFVS